MDQHDWQQATWAEYHKLPRLESEIQRVLDELTEEIRRATGRDDIEVHLDTKPIDRK